MLLRPKSTNVISNCYKNAVEREYMNELNKGKRDHAVCADLREEEKARQALHVPQDTDEDYRPQEHQR